MKIWRNPSPTVRLTRLGRFRSKLWTFQLLSTTRWLFSGRFFSLLFSNNYFSPRIKNKCTHIIIIIIRFYPESVIVANRDENTGPRADVAGRTRGLRRTRDATTPGDIRPVILSRERYPNILPARAYRKRRRDRRALPGGVAAGISSGSPQAPGRFTHMWGRPDGREKNQKKKK